MKKRFNPIKDKSSEIIEFLMASPDMPEDEALRFKLRLSIEEAVENVVRYAYDGGIGWLEAGTSLDHDSLILTIELRDAGVPFNPLEKGDPDITLSAEEREIGGLGIFLCKKMMDSIQYRYEDGNNILTMTKKSLTMNVTITNQDNKTLVVLDGRLDTSNADQFQQDIAPLMEGDKPDIDIDCTAMSYTSSQGLRLFLMLQKSVMARGGKMVMRNMNPQVKEVFDITGFSNIITII